MVSDLSAQRGSAAGHRGLSSGLWDPLVKQHRLMWAL